MPAASLFRSMFGRPFGVIAKGTGRVRAIGGDGRGMGVGATDAGQAPRQVGTSAAETGAARYLPGSSAEEDIGGRLPISRFGVDPAVRGSNFADAIRRPKDAGQAVWAGADDGGVGAADLEPDAGRGPGRPSGQRTGTERYQPGGEPVEQGRGYRVGRCPGGNLAPLAGAPLIPGPNGPDPRVVAVVDQYARENGIPTRRP